VAPGPEFPLERSQSFRRKIAFFVLSQGGGKARGLNFSQARLPGKEKLPGDHGIDHIKRYSGGTQNVLLPM
jgi:hypothetical protein